MNSFVALAKRLPIAPLCLTFLGAMLWPEMELLVPSLPAMKLHFGVSDGQIQQLLSINFVGFLCGVLLIGPLCDSFGRKRVSIIGALIFLLASILAVFADTFSLLMVMRFMQGLAVTAPIIGGSAMLLEVTNGERQIFWMSISSAAITLCMAGAPLVGAFINELFGFKGNLWAIFIAAFIGIVPVIFFVEETLPQGQRASFNLRAVVQGYKGLLKNMRFMGMVIVISGLPAAYWVYTGVSSLYMVDYLQLEPELFGRYQGPIVGTFAIISLLIPRLHRAFGLKRCLSAGFVLMLVGASALLLLALAGIEHVMLTTFFMTFFVGGMVPVNSLLFPSALNMLHESQRGSAQSLIQAMRLTIASLGTMTLGVFYSGPFLPVALILVVLFILCWVLLYCLRHRLALSVESTSYIGGH